MIKFLTLTFLLLSLVGCSHLTANVESDKSKNVIFFHPDGMSVSHWTAVRMFKVGPDKDLNWDKLSQSAVYRGHLRDQLSGTSNGGATIHAYGVKVGGDSFGNDNGKPILSANGKPYSLLIEAMRAGKSTALIQSGHLCEPGTAAFVASSSSRREFDDITEQIVNSGVDVILGGGERYLLPKGTPGRFGIGVRRDNKNLIQMIQNKGYKIVYTRDELLKESKGGDKIFGIFASDHTFNDQNEANLRSEELSLYQPNAPTIAEMAIAALEVVSKNTKGFFIVAEEEGTDNFSNLNNAAGFLEAGMRADDAIGIFLEFAKNKGETLLLTTSDSDAGGLQVRGDKKIDPAKSLPAHANNGSPIDGVFGAESPPFMAQADQFGIRHPFSISWANYHDSTGGILIKAIGPGSEKVRGTLDNTDVFRIISESIF
jgi:alkaline phosphatase